MFQMTQLRRRALLALFVVALAACGAAPDTIAVGKPAPAFTLPATGGNSATLAAYRGKQPVLLFFHMADG